MQYHKNSEIHSFVVLSESKSLTKCIFISDLPTPVYYFINRGYDGVTGTLPTTEIYYTTTAIPPGAGFSGGSSSSSSESIKPRTNFLENWIWENMNKFVILARILFLSCVLLTFISLDSQNHGW